ncbi:MAG: hypothetical protein NTW03_04385, partial [Verrucomicrobia bacterium]|nr:hypothetical protein [Verrucomicrobiota bacterium]
KGSGSTFYCINSSAVRLYRSPWDMPYLGGPITTTGLISGPLFADTGVDTNGLALPGDGGVDLEQGSFHYYAINVPTNNGGLFRMVMEAISGNPDLYIRVGNVPTLTHSQPYPGTGTASYERYLTGTTTEYGNWVPNQGRYEIALSNGVWYVAVRATGLSNCRYRLRLSTGSVVNLALDGSVTNQLLVAGDWRYYKFYLPTNGPTNWNFTFQQHVGDVIVYVRDTIPPGQYAHITDYRDWADDNKNHAGAGYRTYDPPATYTNRVPPLRPGHFYYLGFRAISDATFSLSSTSNTTLINVVTNIAFYGGTVTNFMASGQKLVYRIDVPPEATRWLSVSIHSNSVKWYLEQGSLPTETSSDHSYSGSSANVGLNQYLLTPNGWPWQPSKMYFLVASNSSALSQPFFWRMDGRQRRQRQRRLARLLGTRVLAVHLHHHRRSGLGQRRQQQPPGVPRWHRPHRSALHARPPHAQHHRPRHGRCGPWRWPVSLRHDHHSHSRVQWRRQRLLWLERPWHFQFCQPAQRAHDHQPHHHRHLRPGL